MQGETVKEIDISLLQTGMYFIQLEYKGSKVVKKLVKQ